jgi:hypothetical protein
LRVSANVLAVGGRSATLTHGLSVHCLVVPIAGATRSWMEMDAPLGTGKNLAHRWPRR